MIFLIGLNAILALLSSLLLLLRGRVVFCGGAKILMCLGFFLQFLGLSVANAIQVVDLSSYILWVDWDVVFTFAFYTSPMGGVFVCLAVIYAGGFSQAARS